MFYPDGMSADGMAVTEPTCEAICLVSGSTTPPKCGLPRAHRGDHSTAYTVDGLTLCLIKWQDGADRRRRLCRFPFYRAA